MTVVLLVVLQVLVPPDVVRKRLDAICAGWQLAPVIPEIAEEIRARTPSWPPNMIPGDFNGDGIVDVAILAECKGSVRLVVFIGTPSGFTTQEIEQPQPYDPRQFLHLIRKEYEFDAIGVEYEAIGGHAWIWRAGQWQMVKR